MGVSDIKSAGLRVTSPRVWILELFENSPERHFSADAVYQRLLEQGKEVGLATVYRVLTQFEESGLVKKHFFEGDHAVFELNDDEHHDHLVCMKTGKVTEFYDPIIERRQRAIAREHGFELVDHQLVVFVQPKKD